eukprot:2887185-Amphidinium_carterae.1
MRECSFGCHVPRHFHIEVTRNSTTLLGEAGSCMQLRQAPHKVRLGHMHRWTCAAQKKMCVQRMNGVMRIDALHENVLDCISTASRVAYFCLRQPPMGSVSN